MHCRLVVRHVQLQSMAGAKFSGPLFLVNVIAPNFGVSASSDPDQVSSQ